LLEGSIGIDTEGKAESELAATLPEEFKKITLNGFWFETGTLPIKLFGPTELLSAQIGYGLNSNREVVLLGQKNGC
jgi:hypothetical protein